MIKPERSTALTACAACIIREGRVGWAGHDKLVNRLILLPTSHLFVLFRQRKLYLSFQG